MIVLGVDPGTYAGAALSKDGRIVLVGTDPFDFVQYSPDVVIIELPFVYPEGRTKNPNALIKLAVKVGEIKRAYRRSWTLLPHPREWNGGAEKDWTEHRVWSALDRQERKILRKALLTVAPSRQHNQVDGVAINLWYCEKEGVRR